jgi:hypothetical protein
MVILIAPPASARPLVPQPTLPEPALGILDVGDTKLEQGSEPQAWVTLMCFIMILAGLAWTAWIRSRTLTPRWCRHALLLLGLLSLAVSIAWTTILHTVPTNQSPRYLALGCWLMLMIAFIAESHQKVEQHRQYAFMIIPAFLFALHLTLFLVSQHIELGKGQQLWGPRRFYENSPIFFNVWVILMRWIYHGRTIVGRIPTRRGGNMNPEDFAGLRQGGDPSVPMEGLSASGGVLPV